MTDVQMNSDTVTPYNIKGKQGFQRDNPGRPKDSTKHIDSDCGTGGKTSRQLLLDDIDAVWMSLSRREKKAIMISHPGSLWQARANIGKQEQPDGPTKQADSGVPLYISGNIPDMPPMPVDAEQTATRAYVADLPEPLEPKPVKNTTCMKCGESSTGRFCEDCFQAERVRQAVAESKSTGNIAACFDVSMTGQTDDGWEPL